MAIVFAAHPARMGREQRDPVADHQGLLDRVGHEEERHAGLVPEGQQLLLHLAPGERVQRREGLVHQEHLRLHGERPGDGDALLHAAGELVRVAGGESREPDLVDRGARPLQRLGAAEPAGGA